MHLNSKTTPPQRISRDERRQQTLLALRESALREFAHFGVSGTSAERIAEAAGFTRGAFYANFENKQALLLDLIGERMATEQASWLELSESELELDTLLDTLNERALRFDPHGLWSMISAETYLYALRDPAFAQQYRVYHDSVRSTFTRIVGNLFERAGKRPPVPLEDLCDAFLALNRSVRLPAANSGITTPEPISSELLITLLRGVMAIAPSAA
jgi:AcrR family transcriptional regulator